MAILFKCTCGKGLKVQDEHAGKKTRCVQCGTIVVIPKMQHEAPKAKTASSSPVKALLRPGPVKKTSAPLEDPEIEKTVKAQPRAKPLRKPKDEPLEPVEVVEEEENDEDTALIDEDEEDKRPRKKKKRKKERPSQWDFSFERSAAISGVLLGILMMVGSVVWFVVGLINNFIFFYPPILFVVGLVAVIKGLVGK